MLISTSRLTDVCVFSILTKPSNFLPLMTSMIFLLTNFRLFSEMFSCKSRNWEETSKWVKQWGESIPTIWVKLPWSHNHWLFSPSFLCTSPIRKENVNTFNSWSNFLLFQTQKLTLTLLFYLSLAPQLSYNFSQIFNFITSFTKFSILIYNR